MHSSTLGCSYLSPSFHGVVSKNELIAHCAYREDLPEATVYDWTRLYRQGVKEWGLSIPWNALQKLPEEELEVEIETETYSSSMKVLDLFVPGQVEDEIIINAHNCHPFQANDDISGCAAAIAAFIDLLGQHDQYYSFRLLIGPELFAPMFWLEQRRNVASVKACILLKSVGNDSPLKLQKSYTGHASIDEIAQLSIREITGEAPISYSFRSYYGNDETVFEAPGFEVPTVTLTRFPFLEYHTDQDTPERLSIAALNEVYDVVMHIINVIETNLKGDCVQPGLYCLSHPDYDLYCNAPEPGISQKGNSQTEKSWNLLMNCLSRELGDGASLSQLCKKYQIMYETLHKYICLWESKGLVTLKRSEL